MSPQSLEQNCKPQLQQCRSSENATLHNDIVSRHSLPPNPRGLHALYSLSNHYILHNVTHLHFLLICSRFCHYVSEHHHKSVTRKITCILNWYIQPDHTKRKKKKKTNIEFLPYDLKVTIFTTSHAIPIYVFFLCANNI